MTQVNGIGQDRSTQVSDPGQRWDRPRYPLAKAAEMTGVSLSTIKRKRAAGAFPNAEQDAHGTWLIPVEDLLGAGLHINSVTPIKRSVNEVSDPGQPKLTQVVDPGQQPTTQVNELGQLELRHRVQMLETELAGALALVEAERRSAERAERRADVLEYVIRHQLPAGTRMEAAPAVTPDSELVTPTAAPDVTVTGLEPVRPRSSTQLEQDQAPEQPATMPAQQPKLGRIRAGWQAFWLTGPGR